MNVTMHDLNISWEACFQRTRTVNPTINSSSKHPLKGVLKLNFNRSFLKEERKGGYRGVIKNNNGQVIFCLSDPVDCINANKAEVYAMFMGCREL